jgi:thiamine-monophosphate kinase
MRKTAAASGEDRLIAEYFAPLARHPGALGLADDAALLTPPAGSDLVLTKDAIVAGVHFFADDPPQAIARKALRVNLSDLAAKGAAPAGFLLALALPEQTGHEWLRAFAMGLGGDADAFGCPLLGGDTVRSPGPLMISVTAFGFVPHGRMVQRHGARTGERVIVTGTIGDAALGLALRREPALAGRWGLAPAMREHLLGRYLEPQPRTGAAVPVQGHASAAMDVSDGLAGDLAKLCRASGVSAAVDVARVPLSAAARQAVASEPAMIATVLSGGDDYEILCSVSATRAGAFIAALADAGIAAAEIGQVVAGEQPPQFLGPDGTALALERTSFSHF